MDKNIYADKTGFIHIVGMNSLQNELLLLFLKEKNDFMGRCAQNLKSCKPLNENEAILPQLFLLDYESIGGENCWSKISEWRSIISSQCFVAFCNVDPELEIEKTALKAKIHGLFFKNDPPHVIARGICAILNGELWYSRNILKKIVNESNFSSDILDHANAFNLTRRETEIITLIASGQSNKVIADDLCISIHTVKNHLYNIFKKTNVNSRFQAALWAMKYIINV